MTTTATAQQLDLFAAPTVVETFRWVARGFTDDVTTCEHCGRDDLKGTVRMVALDADGGDGGEQYMGTVCAARMTGRKSTEIRTEAARADRAAADAVRAAHRAWSDAHHEWFMARRTDALGPNPSTGEIRAWCSTPEHRAAEDAWYAANPRPW